jgi:D-sedoheptulose 7-phosphate isomerase
MLNVRSFVELYTKKLITLIEEIDAGVVCEIVESLELVAQAGGRVYVIGNGGSAATASHMTNDLGVSGLGRRGLLSLDMISLADNTSVMTALANDVGYENVFYEQLRNRLCDNDLVIAFSCSGNSSNVIKAIKYAKTEGTKVVGVSGFDGGELMELADINFHVRTEVGDYGFVEDVHMILDHLIYSYYLQLMSND